MYDLVSIGSVTRDITVVTDRGKIFKTPRDLLASKWLGFELGEKIKVDEVHQSMGGVAIGVSLGLQKLGFNSLPFSTLGDDEDARWLTKEIKKRKVKIGGIAFKKGRATPFSILLVDKKSGERVIFSQKSSGDLDLSSIFRFKTKFLYVSSLKGKIKEQTKIILDYLKKNKTGLIVSPSTSQIRDDFIDLKKIMRNAQIIFLNRNEALEIASRLGVKVNKSEMLLNLISKLGPETVCLTDGQNGAYVSHSSKIYYSPIEKVETVDVTGAGDSFAAGFLGFYLKGESLQDSLRAGILNSASVVRYLGTTRGLLSKKEIIGKLKKVKVIEKR
ncbi:MAG: carbohydrate kinase family protein [Parcubacteria group bacterium]|jgi:sugar/nucleoside kinase (ribokinase family)